MAWEGGRARRIEPEPGRRAFLRAAACTGSALATGSLSGLLRSAGTVEAASWRGSYGPLLRAGPELALPRGFSYARLGVQGTLMSDGHPTPPGHDGMSAFAMKQGRLRLVRNHENLGGPGQSAFGDLDTAYDARATGGTTTLELELVPGGPPRLLRDFVSLNGTAVNCAGGLTPWGSWLSCEEGTAGPAAGLLQPHGYVFEVPAQADDEVAAVPLRALGRFRHEAAAVDPSGGAVYLTEDAIRAGFYRFLPDQAGQLAAGGQLQMLAVADTPGFEAFRGAAGRASLPVAWVDIAEPDPTGAESDASLVFGQGQALGGAIFTRLEGCWFAEEAVFFVSTTGGPRGLGQIWRYMPRAAEGETLVLLHESNDTRRLRMPDNVTVTPQGALLLCEDKGGHNKLRGLGPDGIFPFAYNRASQAEFCGATFSPDGSVLFVNLQGRTAPVPGMTLAIWGPWQDGPL